MKYVLTWTPRLGGSGTQNEEAAKRAYELYQKWTPPSGLNILQFLARADGEGGFAVVETDNPGDLAGIASKFAPYLIAQNYLVVEMEEWAALTGEGIEFRGSRGRGNRRGLQPAAIDRTEKDAAPTPLSDSPKLR